MGQVQAAGKTFYVFANDMKRLYEAFEECLGRATDHAQKNVENGLEYHQASDEPEGNEWIFDAKMRGDEVIEVNESNIDDILTEILANAGVSDALMLIGKVNDESGDVRVPVIFFSEDFIVGDVDMAGDEDALCCISVSYGKDIDTALKCVMNADPVFDFWNNILIPLGLDDDIEEKLDAAGINLDNFDHAGGETNDGICYHDLYYQKHDEE
jgi:hypothetical protein